MAKDFFIAKRPHNGMTYTDFIADTEDYLKNVQDIETDGTEKKLQDTISLNLHRSKRIARTYKPDEVLIDLVKNVDTPQLWMVITEDWCGDSAQNLPYIAALAELNSNIDLRILLRDDNPDIMDHYLTNGISRSIPILVAFEENGEELFRWGPRPAEAQELVDNLKSQGYSKNEFIEKLHLWYAKNRGKNLEKELIDSLSRLVLETA